jgi:hypothetical protein
MDSQGYYYTPIMTNLLKNRVPKMVDKSNPYSIDNIKQWCINNKKPFILLSEEYVNAKTPLLWQCLKEDCCEKFEMTWDVIRKDAECTMCTYYKGESRIKLVLNQLYVNFIREYSYIDCKFINKLEFDFYLPQYNLLIEYQGQQHYEPVDFAGKGEKWSNNQFKLNQKRDNIKREYCKKNNIRLLEIPYWDYNNIESILIKELGL